MAQLPIAQVRIIVLYYSRYLRPTGEVPMAYHGGRTGGHGSSTVEWVAPSGCCARGPRAGAKLLWSCWEAESSTALWVAPSGCCARGPRADVKLLWSYCEAECSTALWVAPSGCCARGPRAGMKLLWSYCGAGDSTALWVAPLRSRIID